MFKSDSQIAPMPVLMAGGDLEKAKSLSAAVSKRLKKQKTSTEDRVSRLEKYEELDRNHPLNRPFQGNPRFRGPVLKRKYTNMLCVLIFFLCNGAFVLYGVKAWLDGAAGRLTKGMDFRAEICGLGKLKNKKYLYFASPSIDVNVKFCVEECPTSSGQQICLYDVNPNVLTPFCYTQGQATASGRYCYPDEPINKKVVDSYLSTTSNYVRRIAGDLNNSLDLMAIGVLLSLLVASAFLKVMYAPGQIKYVIWGSIWCTVIVCLILAEFFYRQYQATIKQWCIQGIDRHDCGGTMALIWKYLSYGTAGFTFIYILIIMKLFNRINLGVGTLGATAKCSTVFSQLKFLPWVMSIVITIVCIFFFVGVIYGFSVGEIIVIPTKNIDGGYSKTIVFDNLFRWLALFNVFMLQWWVNVILLVSDSIQAYALSMWYFERRKETVILPVKMIVKNVLKFHLGTIVMLSLYKIVFRPVKSVLGIFKKVLRVPKQHRNIVRFMQACCLCCIHVYERFLRYQSKYTLVQMVMWSESYRYSSKRGFFLLFRHRNEVRNLDDLVTFILFLTKVVCSLFGGLVIYVYISVIPRTPVGNKTTDIETPLAPTVLVFYLGFFFASIFQSVLDIAAKTLLQCFLMDSEMFVGEQRFAEKTILNFMDYFRPDKQEEAIFGKVSQYVKGMKATLNPQVNMVQDYDPDEEENKRFDKAPPPVKEEEYQEEEGEVDPLDDEEKKESSEEESSEEDSEEESDEFDDDAPELLKGSIFESQHPNTDISIEFGKTIESVHNGGMETTSSKNNLLASLPPVNKSYLGKSNLSFFGRGLDVSKRDDKKEEEAKKIKKEEEEKEDEEDEEDEDEEEEESNEEEEKEEPVPLFGGVGGNKPMAREIERDAKEWESLEMSSLTHNQTVNNKSRREFLKNRAEGMSINLQDVSTLSGGGKSKIIDKSAKASNTMKSDVHNIFNKSKIADNTTMKLDYDEDDDAIAKYRF